MRTAFILFLLLSLSACADGRWVAQDLSSFSFQFAAPEPAGPFAKSSTAGRSVLPGPAPIRSVPQDLAAAGVRNGQ